MDQSLRKWVRAEAVKHSGLCRLGYFGSFARGDWGVGSDLDIIAIVEKSSESFDRRNLSWDLSGLPVHADLLIYTKKEWERLQKEGGLFIHALTRETVWIIPENST